MYTNWAISSNLMYGKHPFHSKSNIYIGIIQYMIMYILVSKYKNLNNIFPISIVCGGTN